MSDSDLSLAYKLRLCHEGILSLHLTLNGVHQSAMQCTREGADGPAESREMLVADFVRANRDSDRVLALWDEVRLCFTAACIELAKITRNLRIPRTECSLHAQAIDQLMPKIGELQSLFYHDIITRGPSQFDGEECNIHSSKLDVLVSADFRFKSNYDSPSDISTLYALVTKRHDIVEEWSRDAEPPNIDTEMLECELVQAMLHSNWLALSGVYAPDFAPFDDEDEDDGSDGGSDGGSDAPQPKPTGPKTRAIIGCHQRGMTDVARIAREAQCKPSTVTKVRQRYPDECRPVPFSQRRVQS
jgi:hypothetical protein